MFKSNFLVIALVIIIVAMTSFWYVLVDDQRSSLFEQVLSIFRDNNNFNDNQELGLSSDAFRIGQLGRPMANGSGHLSLIELFAKVENSVVQIITSNSGSGVNSYLNRFTS